MTTCKRGDLQGWVDFSLRRVSGKVESTLSDTEENTFAVEDLHDRPVDFGEVKLGLRECSSLLTIAIRFTYRLRPAGRDYGTQIATLQDKSAGHA